MPRAVVFSPEAGTQLLRLYRYIAEAAGADIADRYTDAVVDHCERLSELPERAIRRDDIRPGLHLTHYKRRTMIAYAVDESRVTILGIFHGGQDHELHLRDR